MRERSMRKQICAFAACTAVSIDAMPCDATPPTHQPIAEHFMTTSEAALSQKQRMIGPIAAFTATGDIERLGGALNAGLNAGLSVSDCKEMLVQLYAYAGFPRSLNGLAELMKVVDERKKRGVQDIPGREASPVPTGADVLALGTSNQTKLSGAPVKGALFDFAPAIDQYLKVHLFGDIFARDNLDWVSRELATIGALSAMAGVESQLQSHVRIGTNVGLTPAQIREFAQTMGTSVTAEAGKRIEDAVLKLKPEVETR